MTDIYKFNKYYSIPKIKVYIKVLTLRGFIYAINPGERRVLYYITDSGVSVIEEIESNYNSVLYKFCSDYSIVL